MRRGSDIVPGVVVGRGIGPANPVVGQADVFDEFNNILPVAPVLSPASRGVYNKYSDHTTIFPVGGVLHHDPDQALIGDGGSPWDEIVAAEDRHNDLLTLLGGGGGHVGSSALTVCSLNAQPLAFIIDAVYDTLTFAGLARSLGGQFEGQIGGEQFFMQWRVVPVLASSDRDVVHYGSIVFRLPPNYAVPSAIGNKGIELFFRGNPTFQRCQFAGIGDLLANSGFGVSDNTHPNDAGAPGTVTNSQEPDFPSVAPTNIPGGHRRMQDLNDGLYYMLTWMYMYSTTVADGTGVFRAWTSALNQATGEILDAKILIDISQAGVNRSGASMCPALDADRCITRPRDSSGSINAMPPGITTGVNAQMVTEQFWGNYVGGTGPSNNGAWRSNCLRWWTGPLVDGTISPLVTLGTEV